MCNTFHTTKAKHKFYSKGSVYYHHLKAGQIIDKYKITQMSKGEMKKKTEIAGDAFLWVYILFKTFFGEHN